MSEYTKIVVSGLLLFLVSVLSLISNTDKVLHSKIKVPVPCIEVIDGYYSEINCQTENPYTISLEWYIKRVTEKIAIVVIFIIMLIRPNFPIWITTMWMIFFIYCVADIMLFYGRLPWRYIIDSFLMSVQAGYTIWIGIFDDHAK